MCGWHVGLSLILSVAAPLPPQSPAQLDGAFEYLRKVGTTEVDKAALEDASGVGVVVSRGWWCWGGGESGAGGRQWEQAAGRQESYG